MRMKVYAHRVHQVGPRALEEVLRRIQALSLADRSFQGRDDMRLEVAREENGLWFADFASPRKGHGPGRMGPNAPIEGITLAEGLMFGEDTGIVYDPVTGYLGVQYNHYGPRISGIQNYLLAADLSFGDLGERQEGQSDSDRCGFRIGVVLKADAYARLRRWGIYKSVELTISVPGALAADLDAGRSLGSVLRAPLPEGVETITLGIQARPGREGALGERGVRGIINDVENLGLAVKSAVFRGKPTLEEKTDAVNLVSDRVSGEVTMGLGEGLRYVRQDRWNALERTFRQWLADGRLPRVA